jgi:hypothetical protein
MMLIINYFHFILNYPLSRFPQGGKALFSAPSPVAEGREGGIYIKMLTLLLIADSYFTLFYPKQYIGTEELPFKDIFAIKRIR